MLLIFYIIAVFTVFVYQINVALVSRRDLKSLSYLQTSWKGIEGVSDCMCECMLIQCWCVRTSPVQVEFVCQYSPVVSTCVWDVQTAAQFASDADRDPERTRTRKNRDTAAWIHQGRVDALDVLQKTHTLLHMFFLNLNYVSALYVHNHTLTPFVINQKWSEIKMSHSGMYSKVTWLWNRPRPRLVTIFGLLA